MSVIVGRRPDCRGLGHVHVLHRRMRTQSGGAQSILEIADVDGMAGAAKQGATSADVVAEIVPVAKDRGVTGPGSFGHTQRDFGGRASCDTSVVVV